MCSNWASRSGWSLAFLGLAVGLEAVPQFDEQPAHGLMAQVMPQVNRRVGQVPRALARPQQRRHGIAAGGRVDESLEVLNQGSIGCRNCVAATSGPPNPLRIVGEFAGIVVAGLDLGNTASDRRPRQIRGGGDERYATATQGKGLTSSPASSRFSWSNGASTWYFCRTLEIIAEFAIMRV